MRVHLIVITLLMLLLSQQAKPAPLLQTQISADSLPEYSNFGFSVAIFADYALLGAPGKGDERGQACIYRRSEQLWNLLSCVDPISENLASIKQFGVTVSLSEEYFAIGAIVQATGKNGVVFVYQRQGDSYEQQAELSSNHLYNNDKFASSVSVSQGYLSVGSPGVATSHEGAVYLFRKNTSGWFEELVITPTSSYKSSRFGSSVMLSGEYLIIGDDSHGRGHEGAAYIYRRLDDIWQLQASLKGGEFTKNGEYATSVAISEHYAVIGAKSENSVLNKKDKKSGTAYVYKRTGKLWNHQAKLVASDITKGDNFGTSVAISGDYLVIGSENDNSSSGSAYLFQNINDNWIEVFKFEADDAAPHDNFGHAVAISQDYIAIGATNKSQAMGNSGVGYIYYLNRNTETTPREKALQETLSSINNSSDTLDTDSDGLSDIAETTIFGTDPARIDTDNDGLTDKEEVTLYLSDPLKQDTDNDGLSDLTEIVSYNSDPTLIDTDSDGISDYDEVMVTKTEPALVDSDYDGFTDQQELTVTNTDPTLADTDGDGLTDNEELNIFNTDPNIPDSDNDGFSDGNEVNHYETLPLENSDTPISTSTSTSYYPANSQYGTMAFEDEWPIKGDYDFNDAVFDYNAEETKVDGLISRIVFKVLPVARGAIYENSLRLLINTPVSNISHATMELKGNTVELAPIADGNQSLFIIIEKMTEALPPPSGYKMTNTFSGSQKVNGNLYTLTVYFNSPVSPLNLGSAPYNSFISRLLTTGDNIEVHFPGYFPSKKASRRKFGRGHDDSDKSQDKYYQTKDNLPWAMIIPSKWHHTKERVDLSNGYPDILNWAASRGKKNKNWYKSKRKAKFVFDSVPEI